MEKRKCYRCHDTGLIIEKIQIEKNKPKFVIATCYLCAKGTETRGHIMMHSQNDKNCDCIYSHLLNYWSEEKHVQKIMGRYEMMIGCLVAIIIQMKEHMNEHNKKRYEWVIQRLGNIKSDEMSFNNIP